MFSFTIISLSFFLSHLGFVSIVRFAMRHLCAVSSDKDIRKCLCLEFIIVCSLIVSIGNNNQINDDDDDHYTVLFLFFALIPGLNLLFDVHR